MTPSTIEPIRRASTGWRRSYGTLSPTQAIASGITPAAAAPLTTRASVSQPSPGASAEPIAPTVQASTANDTTVYLPSRSPSGP